MFGIFSVLVTVPGVKVTHLSAGACGYFEAGGFTSLFAWSVVVAVGPFVLLARQAAIAQACGPKAASTEGKRDSRSRPLSAAQKVAHTSSA